MSTDTSPSSTHTTRITDDTAAAMTPAQKRFYASEECASAREALQRMVDSSQYATDSSRAADFVERHMHYLSTHPTTTLAGYISNLKLMTRIR